MVDDLTDDQMQVPYLPTVNPFLWELGHGIWFQEYWVLRHALGGAYLTELEEHLRRLRPRFAPEGERAAWRELLAGVLSAR